MQKLFAVLMVVVAWSLVHAAEGDTVTLNLTAKGGKFEPAELKAPAGKRIELMVKNEGPGAEEFESKELKREKVVPEGQTVKVTLGTLQKGVYKFFGDYHSKTANGKIIVQ